MSEKENKRRDSIKKNFGKHIASLRKSKGWTAQKLADMLDIERTAMTRIETGGINPSLFVITKLADAFEMTIPELFKGFNHKGK